MRIGGAVSDDFVAVERLSARLAVLPLLTGRLQFRELVLRRAEARMTRTAQGNIDFLAPPPQQGGSAPATPAVGNTPIDIDVDHILIEDGTLFYEDGVSGASVEMHGIDATVIATPVVAITGTFSINNIPLALDASLGRTGGDGGRIVAANLRLAEADATVNFTGAIVAVSGKREVRGDVALEGASLAEALAGLGVVDAAGPLPSALRKPFSLAAKISGGAERAVAEITAIDVGGTLANGKAELRVDPQPILNLDITFGVVDLGAWQKTAVNAVPDFLPQLIQTAHAQSASSPDVKTNLLQNLTVNFDIKAPALSYRSHALRDGAFKATLAQGTLTVANASVELPGVTRIKAAATVQLDGPPTFDGVVDMQSGDLRAVAAALGVDIGRIPSGRLTNVTWRSAVQGTPSRFTLADIAANIDTSIMSGRVSWASEPRAMLAVDLTIDSVNLDAYGLSSPVRVTPVPVAATQAVQAEAYGVTPKLTDWGWLATLDADVRVQIGALTAGGVANGRIGIDLGLKDNVLNVRSASFENVAGATAWFSGGMAGFGMLPRFDNMQFDISVTELTRLARVFAWEPPAILRPLGTIGLTGLINGGFAEADMSAALRAGGMTLHVDGKVLTLDQQPHLSIVLEAAHPSYAAFMKAAGQTLAVGTSDPGAVKLTAKVTHDQSATKIDNLDLRIGANTVAGHLDVTHQGGATHLNAAFGQIALNVDSLWPKAPGVSRARGGAQPVALVPGAGLWSGEPFDWAMLQGWHGDLEMSGTSLTLRGVHAQDFKFHLGVMDGAAELTAWEGKLFGAPGQLYLRTSALPEPSVQGEVAFIGGDLGAVARAINGGVGGLKSGGKADFAASFRMRGATPAALVGDLSGSGTVKLATTEAGTGPISALLGAVAAANQLEGLSGQKGGLVTLESRFSAADGRIKIEDATVASKSYGGAFTGVIDLPRWQVDLSGRLRLEARDAGTRPASVPITVKGALDLPNITLLPP